MSHSQSLPAFLAYDIRFKGTLCGTSWARLLPGSEPAIECFQRMADLPAIGLRKSQKHSIHRFDLAGRPLGGFIEDSRGNRVEFGPRQDVDLVLEANMFPLTVIALELFLGHKGGCYRARLPETGEVIQYEIQTKADTLQSSLGERFIFGQDGYVSEIEFPTSEFTVSRSLRRLPSWKSTPPTSSRSYEPPSDLLVETITIDGIDATCARPEVSGKTRAAAVFVGGTGVYDRHGLTARGDLGYHQILDGLARFGIASVRYQKFDPACANIAEAEERLDFKALCSGAGRWLDWLAHQDWSRDLPKILIGHSLGGLVGLALAAYRHDISCLVLLSTPGQPFRRVIEMQNDWMQTQLGLSEASISDSQALRTALLAALEQEVAWDRETVDGRLLPWRRQHRLFRSILDLDPCDLARRGRCPLVIVQGGNDIQVPPHDAYLLRHSARSAGRTVTLLEYRDLDHLLKRNRAVGMAALGGYFDRRRKVPVSLVRELASNLPYPPPN